MTRGVRAHAQERPLLDGGLAPAPARARSTDARRALVFATQPSRRERLSRWVTRAGFAPELLAAAGAASAELRRGRFDIVLAERIALDPAGRMLFDALGERRLPVTAECTRSASPGDELPPLCRLGRLVGASDAMRRVYDEIVRVAASELTVLIVGESGTGKELAAETIHSLSSRRAGPFVAVNCGALAPALLETELYGHERGAFTGADRRRAGLFELATGGTLLLDEITEMPLEAQVKLLRVLESRTVRRVGGTEEIDVDPRVIAATNTDPEDAVSRGRLRADLYYRLMVYPLRMPPLRSRPEDVEALARDFLQRLNGKYQTRKAFADDLPLLLRRRPWPGNVRELRNAVSRAFVMSDEVITPRDLQLAPDDAAGTAAGADPGIMVGMSLAHAERRLIFATLERTGGDRKQASKMLGVSLKTLYSRLEIYRAEDLRSGASA